MHRRVEITWCIRIEIHGEFRATLNSVNEFAVTAAEIQHGFVKRYVLLKKGMKEDAPDFLSIGQILGEACAVDFLEFAGTVRSHCFL